MDGIVLYIVAGFDIVALLVVSRYVYCLWRGCQSYFGGMKL